jgi:hypothetical protein
MFHKAGFTLLTIRYTALFEQLVVFQLVKKLIKFCVNRRFVTVFVRVRWHTVLSQMKPFHARIPFSMTLFPIYAQVLRH